MIQLPVLAPSAKKNIRASKRAQQKFQTGVQCVKEHMKKLKLGGSGATTVKDGFTHSVLR